jgi:hypothetical protein
MEVNKEMPLSRQMSKYVKGRKITEVRLRRWYNGRQWTYDPLFVLDNGVRIAFNVTEGDDEYGVDPIVIGGGA